MPLYAIDSVFMPTTLQIKKKKETQSYIIVWILELPNIYLKILVFMLTEVLTYILPILVF